MDSDQSKWALTMSVREWSLGGYLGLWMMVVFGEWEIIKNSMNWSMVKILWDLLSLRGWMKRIPKERMSLRISNREIYGIRKWGRDQEGNGLKMLRKT